MGEKDITEKTLASYNDVFSDIVNGLLFDGRPVIDPDALSDITPYSMYKADGKVHEQERDVSKFLKTAGNTEQEIRIAFLGFEHQTSYDKDMPLRVIGYDGAAYRAELSAKERYPVITIVLYFGNTHWSAGSAAISGSSPTLWRISGLILVMCPQTEPSLSIRTRF